jgi:hypothetical protein
LEFWVGSEGLTKRTWLQLVRSCALQIVWCPNFKTEEGGQNGVPRKTMREGKKIQGKSKDGNSK